jgi:hypothetical protein
MRSANRKKTGKDPEYLKFIRGLPCLVCARLGGEAAHVGLRGMSQKCPDREAIPLCAKHHRTGKDSHHVLGKKFWEYHDLDRETLVRALQVYYVARNRGWA